MGVAAPPAVARLAGWTRGARRDAAGERPATAAAADRPDLAPSCLYLGTVMHKRLLPFRHSFRYRVFSLWLDVDDLGGLGRRLRLFSHNRFNLFGLYDRDHGARDGSALRPWVEAALADAGIDLAGGKIRVLCFPRVLGYVFNPLSLFYCYHADGRLLAVLYEVRNTFGQKHGYVLPVDGERRRGEPILQSCRKGFYVSPFIGMEATYGFRLNEPDDRAAVLIRQSVPEGTMLLASLTGRRRRLTDANLFRAFFAYPMMTLKVIGAIHWQALRLWRKGALFHRRPPAPPRDVSY